MLIIQLILDILLFTSLGISVNQSINEGGDSMELLARYIILFICITFSLSHIYLLILQLC